MKNVVITKTISLINTLIEKMMRHLKLGVMALEILKASNPSEEILGPNLGRVHIRMVFPLRL